MKLYSWNVNGIRAAAKNGLIKTLDEIKADIWCFQEVRADVENLAKILPFDGFTYSYSTHAEKKGYSGVMTISKKETIQVMEGLGIKKFDSEGRVLTTEFPEFYLINAYFPNTQHELARLDYKLE